MKNNHKLNQFSPMEFFKILEKCGITFFSGIPDSLLKDFCFYVDDHVPEKDHIIAANEGSAMALAVGYHLATGSIPLIYLQNSGLGNLVNPLLSLADPEVYSIPGILLIGWRGEPGIEDEPQHKKQGRITIELLETMEIPYEILSSDSSHDQVTESVFNLIQTSKENNQVAALVVKKDFFREYQTKAKQSNGYNLSRERAIHVIADNLSIDDLIISTTGLPSRELFDYRKKKSNRHNRDFLVVGGMGHANQIALGIALKEPNTRVICLDGDGAIIMHMGALATIGSSKAENLIHIVLNNGAHDSVGGQKTVALDIDLSSIAKNCGYRESITITNEEEIKETLNGIKLKQGPTFIEIRINKGWRKDIGRPDKTPIENKLHFMSRD
tara:strand:- start:78 stop:1229 length:1152 start_codon:yes stop_codon:yes gene_type:complete